MKKVIGLSAVVSALTLMFGIYVGPAYAGEWVDLNGDQIVEQLSGNTMTGKMNGKTWATYYPNHTEMKGLWGTNGNPGNHRYNDDDAGVWSIKDNKYCRTWSKWAGGKEKCWSISSKGEKIRFSGEDGAAKMTAGNPYGM